MVWYHQHESTKAIVIVTLVGKKLNQTPTKFQPSSLLSENSSNSQSRIYAHALAYGQCTDTDTDNTVTKMGMVVDMDVDLDLDTAQILTLAQTLSQRWA